MMLTLPHRTPITYTAHQFYSSHYYYYRERKKKTPPHQGLGLGLQTSISTTHLNPLHVAARPEVVDKALVDLALLAPAVQCEHAGAGAR